MKYLAATVIGACFALGLVIGLYSDLDNALVKQYERGFFAGEIKGERKCPR